MNTSQGIQGSVFTSGTFTFLVGPEQMRFQVHSGVLEALSLPFTKLMKNGFMKESKENLAVLKDINVITFAQFANYCYSRSYRTTPKVEAEPEFDGTLVEGTRCSKCRYNNVTVSIKGTVYCSKCFPYGPTGRPCDALPAAFKDKKYGSTEYTHDQIRTFLDNQLPKDGSTDQLTEHAKVYILADRYLVPSLKALAIHKLHRDLLEYDLDSCGAGEVAELLRYTYANTCGTDDEEGTDNELRELVTTYAAYKAKELLKDKAFRQMLEECGEAAPGFACFLAKRLT